MLDLDVLVCVEIQTSLLRKNLEYGKNVLEDLTELEKSDRSIRINEQNLYFLLELWPIL